MPRVPGEPFANDESPSFATGSASGFTGPFPAPTERASGSLRPGLAWLRYVFGWMVRTITFPVRVYLSVRRSLTVASVAVLLASFLTLNVIWGFPWAGMMGGCVAVLLVGFALNRVMQPRLKVSVALPRSAIAGHTFSVNVRLYNPRYVPAMGLRVGWHREGVGDGHAKRSSDQWEASPPVSVDSLRNGHAMNWHGAMRFDRRGIHPLPPFQVASTFPFHLFYFRREIDTQTKIAITPAPLGGDEDPASQVMLTALGDWAKRLVAGAPVEYVGNREYQVGVPVRRWDFASWARLGRPIVREYQSPSVEAVTVIVDTSWTSNLARKPTGRTAARAAMAEERETFERLMSLAATAISDLTGRRVQLRLHITSESIELADGTAVAGQSGEPRERMLVRLAAAKSMARERATERIREGLEASRSQPVLVLSRLDLTGERYEGLSQHLASNVTYFLVKSGAEIKHRGGEADSRGRSVDAGGVAT